MNRNSILQARADHLDRMKAILDKAEDEARDLSEAERTEYDDREGEVKSLEERLERLDKVTQAQLRSRELDAPPARKPPSPDLGMSRAEVRRFSFLRVLHALANPGDRRAQEAASFERECSDAMAKRMGKGPQGFYVPSDVLSRDLSGQESRDLVKGTATAGGHLVATDLLAQSFIELLRNRLVVNRLGARVLTDLVGNIAIPRQTAGATAYWVAESGAPTESQQAFDQVTMTPKTLGAYTDYSRKLMLQSSIDIEQFVRMDLATVLALAIDLAALYGTAANNQPRGITLTSGINTTTFAAAVPTWAEVVAMETAVAADNADIGALKYCCDATIRGGLKTKAKDSGSGLFVWETGNTVNGYPCEVSNQVTAGDVFFGNWADLLVGTWGGLDLMVDPYTGSTSGTVRVVALQDVDIAVRHPESFCFSNDGA